jgi:hypothetical protein
MKQPIIMVAADEHFGHVLRKSKSFPIETDSMLRRWLLGLESGLTLEVDGYEYLDRVEITRIDTFS